MINSPISLMHFRKLLKICMSLEDYRDIGYFDFASDLVKQTNQGMSAVYESSTQNLKGKAPSRNSRGWLLPKEGKPRVTPAWASSARANMANSS